MAHVLAQSGYGVFISATSIHVRYAPFIGVGDTTPSLDVAISGSYSTGNIELDVTAAGVVTLKLNGSVIYGPTANGPGIAGYVMGSISVTNITIDNLEVVSGTSSIVDNLPHANFTFTPNKGVNPLAIAFTDTSDNTPTSWLWHFGDGNTSTIQNPSHTYTTAGTYAVMLMATNANGSTTTTIQMVVESLYTVPIPNSGSLGYHIEAGSYYVGSDTVNKIGLIFDSNDVLIATFNIAGGFTSISALSWDGTYIFVTDTEIKRFDINGSYQPPNIDANQYDLNALASMISLNAELISAALFSLNGTSPGIHLTAIMLRGNAIVIAGELTTPSLVATLLSEGLFRLSSNISPITLSALKDAIRKVQKVIAMNIKTASVTEYTNFDKFTGFGVWNDKYIGAASDGIYSLEGDNDAGKAILASFALPDLDMDINYRKKIIDLFIAGKLVGTLSVKHTLDGDASFIYSETPQKKTYQELRFKFGRGDKGRYHGLVFSEKQGKDFTIDSIRVLVNEIVRVRR